MFIFIHRDGIFFHNYICFKKIKNNNYEFILKYTILCICVKSFFEKASVGAL